MTSPVHSAPTLVHTDGSQSLTYLLLFPSEISDGPWVTPLLPSSQSMLPLGVGYLILGPGSEPSIKAGAGGSGKNRDYKPTQLPGDSR